MSDLTTIYVVDDDDAVRRSLRMLISSVGLNCEAFASGDTFLSSFDREAPGCLVLDIRMPEINGLQVQERLADEGVDLPIILLSGYADVPSTVRAMKFGAVDVLEKPFNGHKLLERIQEAVKLGVERRSIRTQRAAMMRRSETLTPRERQVFDLIADGKINKEIANLLGVGLKAIEKYRGNLMRKMEARTPAELARMHMIVHAELAVAV